MRTEGAAFDRAMGRVRIMMLCLAAAGAVAAGYFKGLSWSAGFLLGAIASLINFNWLHQLVASLGEGGRRPRKRLFVFLISRYFLLGAGGYVIVVYFGLNLVAALLGLLVAAAAVILEILYELVYAGT